jgi:hypothetical protein
MMERGELLDHWGIEEFRLTKYQDKGVQRDVHILKYKIKICKVR